MDITTIRVDDNVLPRPARTSEGYNNLASWVEEAIWGHRLWYRQTPWLLFLEFLNIAEAAFREDCLFTSATPGEVLSYRLYQRIPLRNLIFNNAALSRISESAVADSAKWDEWVSWMNGECEPNAGLHFGYLRDRFAKFDDFAIAVHLLRQTALEPNANRRWSSRFVFPFGAAALYEDLNIKGDKAAREAINFGRTGDLLYMMLSRSSQADALAQEFSRRLAAATIPTKIIERLLPPESAPSLSPDRKGGYLPYKKHPAYDRLASDWMSVMQLGLPGQDAYAHLVPLGALHVLIYLMETATAWLNRTPPVYVCEVIGPNTQFVRQRSTRSYIDNDGLSWAAVERAAQDFMTSPRWREAVESPAILTERERVEAAVHLLEVELWMDRQELGQCGTLDNLKQTVTEKLRDKVDDNIHLLHSAYGRNCGLVSKRGARSYRYAPTDSLLKTLVLTNVKSTMEISEFLTCVFRRYRLVFGPSEAKDSLPNIDYDETAFQKNRDRLEERLRSMGLLNRLSDGVAFVQNPLNP